MKSLDELKKIKELTLNKLEMRNNEKELRVVVGMATCGISAGAKPVLSTLMEEVKEKQLDNVQVVQTGCIGMCTYEPLVEVFAPGKEKVTYIHVTTEKAKKIAEEHLKNGNIVTEYTIGTAK